MSDLDPKRVEQALRGLIADIDYDIHKELEGDEGGPDEYPRFAEQFIKAYGND